MLKGNKKLFLNHYKLTQMLSLRLMGFSIRSIAILYNCDHTTISAQCQKYHIKPEKVYDFERLTRNIIKQKIGNIKIIDNEIIHTGKTYKEYLNIPQKKRVF
jgi:hypothetical protein